MMVVSFLAEELTYTSIFIKSLFLPFFILLTHIHSDFFYSLTHYVYVTVCGIYCVEFSELSKIEFVYFIH